MFEGYTVGRAQEESVGNIKETLDHEQIKTIENLSIRPGEKVELILVSTGLKSIAEIEITSETWESQNGDEPRKIDISEVQKIKDGVESLGLAVEVGAVELQTIMRREDANDKNEIETKREKIEIRAATSKEGIKRYSDVIANEDDEKMGEMYGFPKSSIDAYRKEQQTGEVMLISRFQLPEEIKKQEESLFLNFMISKDDIDGAMRVAKKWAEKVKEISPEIYRQYVEDMRNMVEGK